MPSFTMVVERDAATGLYVGWVPGIPGAHSQAATLDELDANIAEVLAMLAEDDPIEPQSHLIGTRAVQVR